MVKRDGGAAVSDGSTASNGSGRCNGDRCRTRLDGFIRGGRVRGHLDRLAVTLRRLRSRTGSTVRTLRHGVTHHTLRPLFAPVCRRFTDRPLIISCLGTMFTSVIARIRHVMGNSSRRFIATILTAAPDHCTIGIVIDRAPSDNTPIIFRSFPARLGLLNRIRRVARLNAIAASIDVVQTNTLRHTGNNCLLLRTDRLLRRPCT